MPEAVIVATGRSPIGRANKGSLADVRPEDLLGVGDEGRRREVGRRRGRHRRRDLRVRRWREDQHRALRLRCSPGSRKTVPATTVNRYCSSSLQAIRMAFHAIKAGEGDTYLVGGSERSSRLDSEKGTTFGDGRPMGPNPVLQEKWELFIPMGMTAENVADKYDVSRERHGPVRAAVAGARRRRAGERILRPRDRPVHEGGRHGRRQGRRPARELDATRSSQS